MKKHLIIVALLAMTAVSCTPSVLKPAVYYYEAKPWPELPDFKAARWLFVTKGQSLAEVQRLSGYAYPYAEPHWEVKDKVWSVLVYKQEFKAKKATICTSIVFYKNQVEDVRYFSLEFAENNVYGK